MLYEILDHRHGLRAVSAEERSNVENLLENLTFPSGKLKPNDVVNPIKNGLIDLGWSGKVSVGQGTNISITSVHSDVGLAIQFGNISRIYADFMKLQVLFIEAKIASAIIIVPHKDLLARLSKGGGTDNRCSYGRIARELPIFKKILTIPTLVYGVYTQGDEDVER